MVSRAASSLQDERDKVDVWISVKLVFPALLAMTWAGAGNSNDGRVAGECRHNGDIEVRGGAM